MTDDLAREFVMASHGDLDTVKTLLAAHPELRDVEYDWGPQGGKENGIGAASHVGNRAIAEFFIAQGAQPTICTWAMLADRGKIESLLAENHALANARGAHGITVMFHTALGGSTAIAQKLKDMGCREGYNHALHGAVMARQSDMAAWLLSNGVTDVTAPDWEGKTAGQRAEAVGAQDIVEMLTRFVPSR